MTAPILGRGRETDPAAHKLFTALNRYVENERPDAELAPETLREARKIAREVSPTAKCRSLSSRYNCVGLVFASRRTMVDIDHIKMFLDDDGFARVKREDVVEGDVVVYLRDSKPQHAGVVYKLEDVSLRLDGSRIQLWVLSQWGQTGEYLHKIDEVLPIFGKDHEFWSERIRE